MTTAIAIARGAQRMVDPWSKGQTTRNLAVRLMHMVAPAVAGNAGGSCARRAPRWPRSCSSGTRADPPAPAAGLPARRCARGGRKQALARAPDRQQVRRDARGAGRAHGMSIMRVDLKATTTTAAKRPRVLIVGGQHAGNERVGIEAALRFIESAAGDETLRSQFDITVVPLLTPSALVLGDRENLDGTNTNRTFVDGKWTAESMVLKEMIDSGGFVVVLDLRG